MIAGAKLNPMVRRASVSLLCHSVSISIDTISISPITDTRYSSLQLQAGEQEKSLMRSPDYSVHQMQDILY